MPTIGEIKRERDIYLPEHFTSLSPVAKYNKLIWVACPDCREERWVDLHRGLPKAIRCRPCNGRSMRGENSPSWKGGRIRLGPGYIRLKLQSDDFFRSMGDMQGYTLEHRLVVAKSLGRCLHSWEIVHHKNGIKGDNRIENLQLVSDDGHKALTLLEMQIGRLRKRIALLKADNAILKKDIAISLTERRNSRET